MELIRDFRELSKNDVGLAGGKGASLGEMTQADIPVPPGFVILSSSFERFIEETELVAEIDAILDSVSHEEIHTVENASEKIKALILAAEMPKDIAMEIKREFKQLNSKFVAVRSSATAEDSSSAAWAGQLESYLNTTEKKLLENIRRCWASLFTPRAIFYRFEKGLHAQKISVAVVVQKMVESEVSGIAFSVHPVTQDRNQLIIEASYGLGEAIVSGQVTPDSYVVEKQPRRIIERTVQNKARGLYRSSKNENEWQAIPKAKAEKQALSDGQILELSKLILQIENHYGFPCDIEWALERGKFYIVQSRPITTLTEESSISKHETTEIQKRKSDLALTTLNGESSFESKDVILVAPTMLSKIYSREKTLLYFSMWNDSDRRGWKNFLGHDVQQNLFILPPPGRKGSVWYSPQELADIDDLLKQKLQEDKTLIPRFVKTLDSNWKILFPYLSDKKKIQSIKEFHAYYEHLVDWWSAMNTAFTIPDMKDVSAAIRKTFLKYRVESERYTEKMNKVMIAFWQDYFPELKDITFCIAPSEVMKLEGVSRKNVLREIKSRREGCIMLNDVLHPMDQLDALLQENNLALEKTAMEGVEEIKGSPAYKGKVRGRVKKILSFADMKNFKAGEVLVTEMTNPDYVPIMKVAAAVVTDEGGATCHAAIASRELKIPCIVGTKVATEILQDGDLVEVDASNGIVRKIEADKEVIINPDELKI